MIGKSFGAAIAMVAAVGVASADEVWMSPTVGDIVYEKDVGDAAVLSYSGNRTGRLAMLYVPGMAGSTERYTFWGYWIDPTRGDECGTELTGPDGTRARSWGQAIVVFDKPGFPSGFTALTGSCFNPPYESIRAEAQ